MLKQSKNTKNAFFACFWAYVGQPHNHIGWATSMPFASIYPTDPRTNSWNLCKQYWYWKTQFFWVGHFDFSFQQNLFFCFIPMKINRKLYGRIDGTQFLWLWWFTAKNDPPQILIPAMYILQKIVKDSCYNSIKTELISLENVECS